MPPDSEQALMLAETQQPVPMNIEVDQSSFQQFLSSVLGGGLI